MKPTAMAAKGAKIPMLSLVAATIGEAILVQQQEECKTAIDAERMLQSNNNNKPRNVFFEKQQPINFRRWQLQRKQHQKQQRQSKSQQHQQQINGNYAKSCGNIFGCSTDATNKTNTCPAMQQPQPMISFQNGVFCRNMGAASQGSGRNGMHLNRKRTSGDANWLGRYNYGCAFYGNQNKAKGLPATYGRISTSEEISDEDNNPPNQERACRQQEKQWQNQRRRQQQRKQQGTQMLCNYGNKFNGSNCHQQQRGNNRRGANQHLPPPVLLVPTETFINQRNQQDKAGKDSRGGKTEPEKSTNSNNSKFNNQVNKVKDTWSNGRSYGNKNFNGNWKGGKRQNGNRSVINDNHERSKIFGDNGNQKQQKDILVSPPKLSLTSSSDCSPASSSSNSSPDSSPLYNKPSIVCNPTIKQESDLPLDLFDKLAMAGKDMLKLLRPHVIEEHMLRLYGFPVESAEHEGAIEFMKVEPPGGFAYSEVSTKKTKLSLKTISAAIAASKALQNSSNGKVGAEGTTTAIINQNDGLNTTSFEFNKKNMRVKAVETVVLRASKASTDSGNVSPHSLDSDSSEWTECDQEHASGLATDTCGQQQNLVKECIRCQSEFLVDESTGQYLTHEGCTFHWGKIQRVYEICRLTKIWTCCKGDQFAPGCTVCDLHVWSGSIVGLNGPYYDFVKTTPRRQYTADEDDTNSENYYPHKHEVYALDCEMSYTGRGLDVTKVSITTIDGQLVYEHFVRPDADIVDYNTRFSGITEADLNCNNSKTLAEVQRDMLQFIDSDTILVGHGLDNDLRALRIVHKKIIDTSIVFPHNNGFPYRRALRHLTSEYLNRQIQCGTGLTGHSSFEDARACMELLLWRLQVDLLDPYEALEMLCPYEGYD